MPEFVGFGRINLDAFSDELLKIAEEKKHHPWHGSTVDYKPHLSEEELHFIREHLPHAEERLHYQTPGAAKGAVAGAILAGLPTALAVGAMAGAQHGIGRGFAAGLAGLGVGTAIGAVLGAVGARKPAEKEVHLQARELLQEAGKHRPVDPIKKLAALELEFFKTADLASREYMRGPPLSKTRDEAKSVIHDILGGKYDEYFRSQGHTIPVRGVKAPKASVLQRLNKALAPAASYALPVGGGALAGGLAGNTIGRIRGVSKERRRKHTAVGAVLGGLLGGGLNAARHQLPGL